jgi:hypothetical protein
MEMNAMSVSMYRASIPVFIRGLEVLASLLQKGATYVQEQGLAESGLIDTRLIDDMLPLSGQIQRASDTAKLSAERLSGVVAPRFDDVETTFVQLQDRIANTIAYLKSIDAAQLENSESRTVTMKLGGSGRDFRGDEYLFTFGMPNFFFHVTTAYGILRHVGVPVGKMDFLGNFA